MYLGGILCWVPLFEAAKQVNLCGGKRNQLERVYEPGKFLRTITSTTVFAIRISFRTDVLRRLLWTWDSHH